MLKQCCDLLEQKKLKIAFVESASSGYLCSQFSIYKNSGAKILLGSMVSYDPSIKVEILKIDPALIAQYTAESPEVTAALATQGQMLFQHADYVIACTGLLKPGGSACENKPVGTFFVCIQHQQMQYHFHYLLSGTPTEKLDQLTECVASELIELISHESTDTY